jgi:hypothetical protein
MERSEIRGSPRNMFPHFAALHAGYEDLRDARVAAYGIASNSL